MRTYRTIRSAVAVLALLLPICAWANVYRFHDAVLDNNGGTVTGEFNVTTNGTINSWLVQAGLDRFERIPIFCYHNPREGCDPPFSLATIVSPNHVSFDYQSTPTQSRRLDIFLAGPLNPGDDQITTLSVLTDHYGTYHVLSGVLTGPEPQTWMAFGLGLLLFGSVRVFRKA